MAETNLGRLRAKGLQQQAVVAPEVAELLDALQLSGAAVPRPDGEDGSVQVGVSKRLGFFSLELQLPVEARPYAIDWRGPAAAPTGFHAAAMANLVCRHLSAPDALMTQRQGRGGVSSRPLCGDSGLRRPSPLLAEQRPLL